MTRDEEGVMTIGKTEVSDFIIDEDMEEATSAMDKQVGKAHDSSFILDGDYEEFFITNIIDPVMEKHAAELGVTKSEYKKMLAGNTKEEAMKKPVHPMDTQVGGDHYKTKGLQPLEAVYMNYGIAGLEAAVFTKVNKYFRDKSGRDESGLEKKLEDCKKAQHVLQIFQEKLEVELFREKFNESYNRNR